MKTIIFGEHEEDTIRQFHQCLQVGQVVGGALCADGHYGYSQPVGGVVVYDNQISPSGVGYDKGQRGDADDQLVRTICILFEYIRIYFNGDR